MNNREEAYIAFCKSHDGNWSARDLFNGGYQAGLASQAQQPTDLSKQLREYAADSGYSHNDYADTMLAAASEIERCAEILAAAQAQKDDYASHDTAAHHKWLKQVEAENASKVNELVCDASQAQQEPLKVSENWREPLSADAMQRLNNLGVLDKPPAPEVCSDGGKCGAGGYCITCPNVPAPEGDA